MIDIEIDTIDVFDHFRAVPGSLVDGFVQGATRALSRFRGFHRARRMRRQSVSDPVGLFGQSTGAGIKQNRWFPIKVDGETLEDTHVHITVTNPILKEHELGATKRGNPFMAVPFSRFSVRNQAPKRIKNKLRNRKLSFLRTRSGLELLGEWKKGSSPLVGRRLRGFSRSTFIAYYHLHPTITIPKRLELVGEFSGYAPIQGFAEIEKSVDKKLERLNRGS